MRYLIVKSAGAMNEAKREYRAFCPGLFSVKPLHHSRFFLLSNESWLKTWKTLEIQRPDELGFG
jgi:hypothetical protein